MLRDLYFKMAKEIICGIYLVKNTINNKNYVGKAVNIYHRFWSHKNEASKDIMTDRASPLLFKAMKKHGIDVFELIILERLPLEEKILKERELFWMDYYNSLDRCCGYNLRRDSETKMIVHPETSKKISARLKKEWKNGIRKNHGEKLTKNWENNNERKQNQSKLMTQTLTKYKYIIFDLDGIFKDEVFYKGLVELGYKNVLASMHKIGKNKIKFKGVIIEKIIQDLQDGLET